MSTPLKALAPLCRVFGAGRTSAQDSAGISAPSADATFASAGGSSPDNFATKVARLEKVSSGGIAVEQDGRARLSFAILLTGSLIALAWLLAASPTANATAQDSSCANEEFRQGTASKLPGCRAYEQVSPQEKNGFDIKPPSTLSAFAGGPIAASGGRVAFQSDGSFADATWGGGGAPGPFMAYLATRGDAGWETTSLSPRPNEVGLGSLAVLRFDPSMSIYLMRTGYQLTPEPVPPPIGIRTESIYAQSTVPGSTPKLVASNPDTTSANGFFASADLSALLVESNTSLSPEPGQPASEKQVFEHSGDGEFRIVSREPGSNEPFQVASEVGEGSLHVRSDAGAVSDDGRHAFFSAPRVGNASQIYRRSDGSTTELASPSQRTTADPEGPREKIFRVATGDGNRIFFMSKEELTDAANTGPSQGGMEVYRYDFAADELVAISATPGGNGAEALGVVAIDESGDRVYFAARAQIGGDGAAGEPNIYLWEDDGSPQGTTRFVATLADDPASGAFSDDDNWSWFNERVAEVSADGSNLLFVSSTNINGGNPTGTPQTYLYDAAAAAGTGELACISCPAVGQASGPARAVAPTNGLLGVDGPTSIDASGSRVLFSSPDALVARDTNGHYDAYLWDEGEVSLLSSGQDGHDSFAYGLSQSGEGAFFRTREQLVPSDVDTNVDLYTARVNGGLASQHPEPEPRCQGDTCQGEPSEPLVSGNPGTSEHQGPGNVEPDRDAKSCEGLAAKLDRKQQRVKKHKRTKTKAQRKAKRTKKKARMADGKKAKRLKKNAKRLDRKADEKRKRLKKARKSRRKVNRSLDRCDRAAHSKQRGQK